MSSSDSSRNDNTTSNDPPLHVPEGPLQKNITKVSSPAIPLLINSESSVVPYVLPFIYNHGKPPSRYSLKMKDKRFIYPIANYMSTYRLSKSLKTFAHKLSTDYIPWNTEESLLDPRCSQSIQ